MPGRPHHTEKLRSCVSKLVAKGHDESSAYAICTAGQEEAGNPIFESEYSERRHRQRHALDDASGIRGPLPVAPMDSPSGAGAGRITEDEDAEVPGSIEPKLQYANVEMASRCATCGAPKRLTDRDASLCEGCAATETGRRRTRTLAQPTLTKRPKGVDVETILVEGGER